MVSNRNGVDIDLDQSTAGELELEDFKDPSNLGHSMILQYQEGILCCEGGEALEQVSQRGSGCLVPGSVQDKVGWGSEKPCLEEDVPAHGEPGVGTR